VRWFLLIVLIPTLGFCDPCSLSYLIEQVSPGAQWTLTGNDLNNLVWISATIPPNSNQITAALAACRANQLVLQAYAVELTTTTTAVAGAVPGYVGANAIQQINTNRNMARIIQLRQLLGLQ
jgi:hypothetical protein